jgi:uncharacterized membrane protein
VAVLGIGALSLSGRYSFRTPWVIISLTLYVVVMGVATGYTVPAMRRAAHLMEQGAASQPAGEVDETPPPAASATATDLTAADLAAKERLDYVAGRVVGSGALVLLIVVLITILMVTRPFGK